MPCKPRMEGCGAGCLHRQMVEHYRIERSRQELERESVTGGYATETAEYGALVTFRRWLLDHAR